MTDEMVPSLLTPCRVARQINEMLKKKVYEKNTVHSGMSGESFGHPSDRDVFGKLKSKILFMAELQFLELLRGAKTVLSALLSKCKEI